MENKGREGGNLIFINSAGEIVTEIKSDGDIWNKRIGRQDGKRGGWLSNGIQTNQLAINTDDDKPWQLMKAGNNLVFDKHLTGGRLGINPDGRIDLHNKWTIEPASWFMDFELDKDSKVSFGNSGDIWSKHIGRENGKRGGWFSNGIQTNQLAINTDDDKPWQLMKHGNNLKFDKHELGSRFLLEPGGKILLNEAWTLEPEYWHFNFKMGNENIFSVHRNGDLGRKRTCNRPYFISQNQGGPGSWWLDQNC